MEDDDERSDTRSPSDYNNDEALHEIEQLAKSVTSIKVEGINEYMAQNLLEKLIPYLSKDYNTSFLSDYLKLLKLNNGNLNYKLLNIATSKIMTSIESEMIKGAAETQGEAGVVVAAWLGAAVLWDAPRVPPARDALHALLPQLTYSQTVYLATMWWTLLSPGALLQLSDAIPGTVLAGLLMRATLTRLLSLAIKDPVIPDWEAALVTPEEVAEVFEVTKLGHTTHPRLQRVESLSEQSRVSREVALLQLVRAWARVRALAGRGAALDVHGLSERDVICSHLDVYQVKLAILRLENIFDTLEKPEPESQVSVEAQPEPVASTSTATEQLEADYDDETLFSV